MVQGDSGSACSGSQSGSRRGSVERVGSLRRRGSAGSSNISFLAGQESSTTDDELDMPGHIPRYCLLKVNVQSADDTDSDGWYEPHYEIVRFLSSELFLNHFTEHFADLAKALARDIWLQQSKYNFLHGPTIHCREKLRGSGLRTMARITPTLLVASWPMEMALEWGHRRRRQLVDKRLRQRYVWPPQRVVDEIVQSVGCNVVPQGCCVPEQQRQERHFRPETMAIEWEVNFQQADIRLISSLEVVHIHCWAVAKLFVNHFLSEFSCVEERHLRHLMFWQFEQNFRDWHLESLGSQLVQLLCNLRDRIQERQLPHYFIVGRNMLESVRFEEATRAQERIQRVMENMLPNLIILLSKLKVRNNAFPAFDWPALYHSLKVSRTEMMKELVPELARSSFDPDLMRDSLAFHSPNRFDDEDDEDNIWGASKRRQMEKWRRKQRTMRAQQRQQQLNLRRAAHRTAGRSPLPEFADGSVKLNTLRDDFLPRTKLVLGLFIEHFAAMADRLLDHGSVETALDVYLEHSRNLCTLLEEQGATEDAEQYRQQLYVIHERAVSLLQAPGEGDEPHEPGLDTDLIGMSLSTPQLTQNWSMGPGQGATRRRDFNRRPSDDGQRSQQDETYPPSFRQDPLDGATRTNPMFSTESSAEEPEPSTAVSAAKEENNNRVYMQNGEIREEDEVEEEEEGCDTAL